MHRLIDNLIVVSLHWVLMFESEVIGLSGEFYINQLNLTMNTPMWNRDALGIYFPFLVISNFI